MISVDDVLDRMVEVEPIGEDGFRKIKETLTRMGVPARNSKTLYQSAHILHRRGIYYICSFKEMFEMDGKRSDLTEGDIARRNRIVQMLVDWNLVKVLTPKNLEPMGRPSIVKVIKHVDKDDWTLIPKYTMGVKKV